MSDLHLPESLVHEEFRVQAFHQGPFGELRLPFGKRARHRPVQDLLEKTDASDAVFHEERQKWCQGILFLLEREEGFERAEDPEKILLVVFVGGIVPVEVDDLAPAAQLGGLSDEGVHVEGSAEDDLRLAPVGDGLQKVRLMPQHFSRSEMEQVRRFVEAKELHFLVVEKIFESPSEGVFGGPPRKPRLLTGKRPVGTVRIFDLEPRQHFVLPEQKRLDVCLPAEGFVSGDQFEIDGGNRPFGKGSFSPFPFESFVDEPPLEAAFSDVGGTDHEKEERPVPRNQSGVDLPLHVDQLGVVDAELLEFLERFSFFGAKEERVVRVHSVLNLP